MARARCLAIVTCVVALLLGVSGRAHAQAPADRDHDGLPDAWEEQFGLNADSAAGDDGAAGDPDGDGVTNAAEYAAGSHPRGTSVRLFAEGATGWFDTRFALFNTDLTRSAVTLLRFQREDGLVIRQVMTLAPGARVTIDPKTLPDLNPATFSTIVEADTLVIADRTMLWDSRHYGSHAETGLPRASTMWYFAEGATTGDFSLYYLLQNPQPQPAEVQISYLFRNGPPLVRHYTVAANSRRTIYVDAEDPLLNATEVSAIIQSTVPIVAERSMYTNAGGDLFGTGTGSAGITEPSTEWFLAEGATGPFFDEFVLIANPNAEAAQLTVTFMPAAGKRVEKKYTVAGRTRYTIQVDAIKGLETAEVSAIVRSTNGVPVLVERSMYWPGPQYSPTGWREGHAASGVTASATSWALAEGEQGGPDNQDTYILVANTSTFAADVQVTLYFEDGGTATQRVTVGAQGRKTVWIASAFPEASNRRFAVTIESVGATPAQLVVERSMYSDSEGIGKAAGTVALGTPLAAGSLAPNPEAVTVRAASTQVFEQGSQGTTLVFERGVADRAITVSYAVGGTATPGSDYRTLTGKVSFEAGQTSVSVPVTVYEDSESESAETITISLTPDPGYAIGAPSLVTLRLEDNDTVVVPDTDIDVSRFLTQATFGPREEDIAAVRALGYEGWLDQQFAQPASSFLGYLDSLGRTYTEDDVSEAWAKYAVNGADQLRQRVANALLEIMVVSNQNGLGGEPEALAAYMDILQRNAFGNFRTLLQDVTLSPSMGQYLSHLKNDKPGPNHDPDENYAREVLQLFTIGLIKLNIDGTPQRDPAGAPIPTYDQSVVEGFAHVFTGWTYYQAGTPTKFYDAAENWRMPMVGIQARHATDEKHLLDDALLPPNQLMDTDLRQALDVIFNHQNVGPFVSRQLIQRLVTSNPTPAYIGRVAAVFADNGAGVRGDLRAVVRAILLDPEARSAAGARDPYFGHLREPMIRYINVLRAFHAHSTSGTFQMSSINGDLGQGPFKSPSVFNFFEPDFRQPGTVADLGLYSPEFQIATEKLVATYSNAMRTLVRSGYGSGDKKTFLTLDAEIALAGNPPALADRLSLLLLNGQMSSELRNTIVEALTPMAADKPDRRAWVALSLVLASPEFVVQK